MKDLCDRAHIVALQETWLHQDEVAITDHIHENYVSYSISSMDETKELRCGRPYGGLTWLWHKGLSKYVDIVDTQDTRIAGLRYRKGECTMLLLNVYLPTDCAGNRDEQQLYLGKLASLLDDATERHICVIGDYNARPGSVFFDDLSDLCRERDLVVADVTVMPPETFTHVNAGCLSQSWLDHVVLSPGLHNAMTNCEVLYNSVSSDHFPLLVELNLSNTPLLRPFRHNHPSNIKWNFHDVRKREEYGQLLMQKLRAASLDPARVCSCRERCSDPMHLEYITSIHRSLCQSMLEADEVVFGSTRKRWRQVPGWNEFVRDAHHTAREAFLSWRAHGSPRQGHLAENMRRERARFKLALRWCRAHEQSLRAQSLADKLAAGDSTNFWRELKALDKYGDSLPVRVEQAEGEVEIASMWGRHFEATLNCLHDEMTQTTVRGMLHDVTLQGYAPVTYGEMKGILRDLSSSEAQGVDGLPSGAFIYAPPLLAVWLCVLINACILHQFIPRQVLSVIIVPLLKGKRKDPTVCGSYRPIAIATTLSKIVENVLLHRLQDFLYSADSQFSYKKGHSTELCVWTIKHLTDYYTSKGSPVYLCFLDASKAFDRVNYWKLFTKLHARGAPAHLVNLLVFWYTEQEFRVRWGSTLSHSFAAGNGIRQGSILSPHLFNIYMDGLSHALAESGTGCYVHDKCINSLSYADDMVLIAPTVGSLQTLIATCEAYAREHDIVYNTTKTECMVVPPKNSKVQYVKMALLNNEPLRFVDSFTYLGHVLSSDGLDDLDIKKQLHKITAVGNTILRRFSFCTKEVKLELFRSYCYSIYCNSLWARYRVASIDRLRVCHNDILKRLLGIPRWASSSETFVSNNIKCLDVIRRYSISSLKSRVELSCNSVVSSIRHSCAYTEGVMHRAWLRLLTLPD